MEVSSRNSGSDSDLDTFSLHTPVDTSDDEIGGILLGVQYKHNSCKEIQLCGTAINRMSCVVAYLLLLVVGSRCH